MGQKHLSDGYWLHKRFRSNSHKREGFTYVTFLSGTVDQEEDLEEDKYFIATRILVWQLLHKPQTRANGIDVIVMVTPSVSTSRCERLRRDGAIVYPVDFLHVENDSWVLKLVRYAQRVVAVCF